MQSPLEVTAHGLVDVGPVYVLLRDPVRERLVQLGSELLRHATVGGLTDERVREAPLACRLILRLDQTPPVQLRDRFFDRRRRKLGRESGQGGHPEAPALDGRALQHLPGRRVEPVKLGAVSRACKVVGISTFGSCGPTQRPPRRYP